MLKQILLGGAALVALPAIAQTTGSAGSAPTTSSTTGTAPTSMSASLSNSTRSGTPTTSVDHSAHTDNVAGTSATGNYSQVNGGVTTSATNPVGSAASTNTTLTNSASTPTSVANGSMDGPNGTMNAMANPPVAGTVADGTMAAEMDAAPTVSADATTAMSPTASDPTMSTMTNTPTSYASATPTGMPMSWNFSGDMGQIGSADYGTNRMASASTPATGAANTGMGGPLDIDGQWSTYAGSEVNLTPLQFGTWVLEANGQDVDKKVASSLRSRSDNLPAVQVLNVTAGAFAAADTDNDHRVSRTELQTFAGV